MTGKSSNEAEHDGVVGDCAAPETAERLDASGTTTGQKGSRIVGPSSSLVQPNRSLKAPNPQTPNPMVVRAHASGQAKGGPVQHQRRKCHTRRV